MSPRLILFSALFLFFAIGALFNPLLGILGYMAHYIIGAERQWWHAPLNSLGIRYSLTLAGATAIGIVLNQSRLKYGKFFIRQEVLALMLLAWMWFLFLGGAETVFRYTATDHPSLKITKVMLFCLMMTHVVTRPKDLDKVFWLFVIASFVLGIQAFSLPRIAFSGGRLDGRVGGSDFLEANALAGFMVAATVITSTVFMRTSWPGKIVCALAGAFSMNTIILCRSRGAVLALVGASFAIVVTAPRHLRLKIATGLVVALCGLLYLSDAQFLARVIDITTQADTVVSGGVSADASTRNRLAAWRGGIRMFLDHPLGVGPGNFNQNIGRYSPEVSGLSPHSTYIQALADLGIVGFVLLVALLGNALWTIRGVLRNSDDLPDPDRAILQWSSCGLLAVIVGYATFGITGHLIYLEAFWWFLMMPACLHRACQNALESAKGGLAKS